MTVPATPQIDQRQQALALMQKLRDDFRAKLPKRLDDLLAEYRQVQQGDTDAATELHRQTHALAGAGGTMGLPAVTEHARRMERILKTGTLPAEDEFVAALAAIRQAGALSETPKAIQPPPATAQETLARRILLCSETADATARLTQQLLRFRLPVFACNDLDSLRQEMESRPPPLAVVIDTGAQLVSEAPQVLTAAGLRQTGTKLIVVSSQADFEARLLAVRSGVDVWLEAPLQLPALVEQLERCMQPLDDTPFRVLLVDDDRSVSLYHAAILRSAGMTVEMVHSAENLDAVVHAFGPELLLLDFYMPRWYGSEIARALRLSHEFLSLPIVFLSAEGDRSLQLGAMSQGGDDFLTKPIAPEHLVEAVRIRAQRYRELRRVMLTDPLTGVLNRRALLSELERELARCRRDQKQLSLAVIDVDHFKKVNDSQGHQAGDTVLKALTQLMRQRLRRTDIVGRFGGEEFVVVLSDTALPRAAAVIDEVRSVFAGVQHLGSLGSFQVSFSAGIAAFVPDASADSLLELADQLLYAAKNAGRNRVLTQLPPTPV